MSSAPMVWRHWSSSRHAAPWILQLDLSEEFPWLKIRMKNIMLRNYILSLVLPPGSINARQNKADSYRNLTKSSLLNVYFPVKVTTRICLLINYLWNPDLCCVGFCILRHRLCLNVFVRVQFKCWSGNGYQRMSLWLPFSVCSSANGIGTIN
jgi:hypothetical protein